MSLIAPLPYSPPQPGVQDLERTEQLMLWSLRAIAIGHADCRMLHRTLHGALGWPAEEVFSALFLMVRTLGWCATRRLKLHAPGCEGVSADERLVLDLVACARRSLIEADERELRRRLSNLIGARDARGLIATLQAVASALDVSDYVRPRDAACSASRRLH